MARPSPSCAHDDDRLRLPAASPSRSNSAEKKESTDPRLSQLCPPYVAPSASSSLEYHRSDARIVENGFAAGSGMSNSAKVVLEWRVWREPEGFSRNQRASYESTLFGRRRVAKQRGAIAAALHRAGGALCLLERRAQGLCRGGWNQNGPLFVLLAASAQLLSFRLLSALEIIVRLQEKKPSTLPIADCACLLQILFRLVPQDVDAPHVATPCCLVGTFTPAIVAKCRNAGVCVIEGAGRRRSTCGRIIGTRESGCWKRQGTRCPHGVGQAPMPASEA